MNWHDTVWKGNRAFNKVQGLKVLQKVPVFSSWLKTKQRYKYENVTYFMSIDHIPVDILESK